jgi:hypothetical protein
MRIYYYLPGVYVYSHFEDIEDNSTIPELATIINPLPFIDNSISIIFNISIQKWEYHEIKYIQGVPINYMDDKLTYSDLRALQYPPKEDYLDAIVKNDTEQLNNYVQKCLEVKTRWPKEMLPITRREYYIQVYNMKPYPLG